jgi:hypothetical protein
MRHLRVAREDMMCLTLGTLEVIPVFVRKKNASAVPDPVFQQAMTDFRSEVIPTTQTAGDLDALLTT